MCYKCTDPWITMAYEKETVGGLIPGCGCSGMCNKMLYNGGSWSGYAELCRYVREVILDMERAGLRFRKEGGLWVVGERDKPTQTFVHQTLLLPTVNPSLGQVGIDLKNPLVGQDGASLVGQDGASRSARGGSGLIANNAGKLFSDQGAGLIGKNGAGVVANDGAGIKPSPRGLLSVGGKKTVRIGRGTLVLS